MAKLRRGSVPVADADAGAILRDFEQEYRRIMDAQGVARDEEELAVCNELLRRAERGEYPRDGVLHIVSTRDDVDYASDEAMLALKAERPRGNQAYAGIGVICAALLVAWFLFFKGSGGGSGNSQSVPGAAATQTALAAALASSTPGAEEGRYISATQTALALVTPQWGGANISVGADARDYLAPVYPQTLEVDGAAFRAYPSNMEGGRWEYQDLDGAVSWVAGSVINWSFGVPDTEAGISLFHRLAATEGAEKVAILRLSSGVARRFKLEKPRRIGRHEIEVFAPYSPGLTVALLGDRQGADRWVVRGQEDYADDGYDSDGGPEATPALP
jgi:hypothetical protein